jgi:glutaminyl-peptide cyclotransferase
MPTTPTGAVPRPAPRRCGARNAWLAAALALGLAWLWLGAPEPARIAAAVPVLDPCGATEELRDYRCLVAEPVASYPHASDAYTEGLLLSGEVLYESTGVYGQSSLRRVQLQTGAVLASTPLPAGLFGEGLARVGERLIQLTWNEGIALAYTLDGLRNVASWRYQGSGWGLCFDGRQLVMSDGSSRLQFRDPGTFEPTGELLVTLAGKPLPGMNELECVGGQVYANLWPTDFIVQADLSSGQVRAVIDASALLPAGHRPPTDGLNGIAYRPATDTFLLTGKLWPALFEVRFVESAR